MLGYIVGFLAISFYAYKYMQTRYIRFLWATLFMLVVNGFNIFFDFFVPATIFYSWLGWLKYPFAIIMTLGALSLFLVCFAPIKQQDEPKRARRWRSSIR